MKPITRLAKIRRIEYELSILESRKAEILKTDGFQNQIDSLSKIIDIRKKMDRKSGLDLKWIIKQIDRINKLMAKDGLSQNDIVEWLAPLKRRPSNPYTHMY